MSMTRKNNLPSEPTDALGFVTRGNAYSRNGAYEQAIDSYTKAVELQDDLADAYFNWGVSYYELGEFQLAISDLSRAIDINPYDDNYYGRRSLAYIFADDPDLAQADQDRCEELRN